MTYPEKVPALDLEIKFQDKLAERRMVRFSSDGITDYERVYKEGYIEGFNAALSWAFTDLHDIIVGSYGH